MSFDFLRRQSEPNRLELEIQVLDHDSPSGASMVCLTFEDVVEFRIAETREHSCGVIYESDLDWIGDELRFAINAPARDFEGRLRQFDAAPMLVIAHRCSARVAFLDSRDR